LKEIVGQSCSENPSLDARRRTGVLAVINSTRAFAIKGMSSRYAIPSNAIGQLIWSRRANIADHTRLARSEPQVVGSRLGQGEQPIRATVVLISVAVILPIVLPEADFTDLESRSLAECFAPAARASQRQVARPEFVHRCTLVSNTAVNGAGAVKRMP
jgi:hypothetical protein